LDQTRGWFYTLAILGTALFDKFPFQNVVVNGMVLAEDGKKMSKRLKNYPDPVDVLNTHGADALRLYMIQSPAVRADDLRFSEAGVKDIVRRILLKWWNSYSFFISYAVIDGWSSSAKALEDKFSDNILDQWILSRLQSLLKTIEDEMKQYHLYNVVPGLLDFIEDLTNIYIRFNRKRFWQEENNQDKNAAYQTLYTVLHTFSEVMAPFTPFLAETIFQNLKSTKDAESVHLVDYPLPHREIIDENLEKSVALMNRVILIVRNIREKKNIKVKIPLKRLSIIHRDQNLLDMLKNLENYLREELNVREIQYLTREDDFVELTAKANGASLGKRLGKKFGAVAGQITKLKSAQIVELEQGKTWQLDGETIGKEDVLIYRNAKKGHENVVSDAFITVEIDTTLDPDQIQEGLAREVVSRVQKLRKTADLKLDDRIHVEYQAECEIKDAIQKNIAYIQEQTLALSFKFSENPQGSASEVCEIDGKKILIALKAT
jgi:isoleucyl-tRNA synthetase